MQLVLPTRGVPSVCYGKSSDLLENVQRGILAEYIVATALGITDNVRVGWAGYDLLYGESKIEVKSSSYLQSWKQRALTRPNFGIGPREQWDEETGLSSDPRYVADAFVFCLFAHSDPHGANILNVDQWCFYVVATKVLTDSFPSAKSISEQRLRALTLPVPFGSLRERIDGVLANPELFISREQILQDRTSNGAAARYSYAVAQRGTRAYPVIGAAADYQEAFARARLDEMIASLGADIWQYD